LIAYLLWNSCPKITEIQQRLIQVTAKTLQIFAETVTSFVQNSLLFAEIAQIYKKVHYVHWNKTLIETAVSTSYKKT